MGARLRGMLQSQFSGLCVFRACVFLNGCGFKGQDSILSVQSKGRNKNLKFNAYKLSSLACIGTLSSIL